VYVEQTEEDEAEAEARVQELMRTRETLNRLTAEAEEARQQSRAAQALLAESQGRVQMLEAELAGYREKLSQTGILRSVNETQVEALEEQLNAARRQRRARSRAERSQGRLLDVENQLAQARQTLQASPTELRRRVGTLEADMAELATLARTWRAISTPRRRGTQVEDELGAAHPRREVTRAGNSKRVCSSPRAICRSRSSRSRSCKPTSTSAPSAWPRCNATSTSVAAVAGSETSRGDFLTQLRQLEADLVAAERAGRHRDRTRSGPRQLAAFEAQIAEGGQARTQLEGELRTAHLRLDATSSDSAQALRWSPISTPSWQRPIRSDNLRPRSDAARRVERDRAALVAAETQLRPRKHRAHRPRSASALEPRWAWPPSRDESQVHSGERARILELEARSPQPRRRAAPTSSGRVKALETDLAKLSAAQTCNANWTRPRKRSPSWMPHSRVRTSARANSSPTCRRVKNRRRPFRRLRRREGQGKGKGGPGPARA
jgi:hypothetical protein